MGGPIYGTAYRREYPHKIWPYIIWYSTCVLVDQKKQDEAHEPECSHVC